MTDLSNLRQAVRIDVLHAIAAGEDPSKADLRCVGALAEEILTERDRALASATAEIDRLRAEVASLERHARRVEAGTASALADVAAVAFDIPEFDLHGLYVYFLWGHDGDLLYIGKSTNLLSRLGDHMGDANKRRVVARITLLQCSNPNSLARTEERLIRHYSPPLNIVGIA